MDRRKFIKGSAIIGATIAAPSLVNASGMSGSDRARKVYRVLDTDKTLVGTLPVLRAFAGDHNDYVSPFVFFDEFGPVQVNPKDKPLRVDAHPHAGIVPTTYFLSGSGHHRDSLNFDFQIGRGDFMMFSSGRGAIHMEETGQLLHDEGGIYHGFQIWLNLPSALKWTEPTTTVYRPEQMAHVDNNSYSATVVLGELNGAKSKVETAFPVFYNHIRVKPGARVTFSVDETHNAFIYLIKGDLEAEGQRAIKANQVILYSRGGSDIELFSANGAELLLCGGRPHDEPVVAYGPFVMNSEAEIRKCYQDYSLGKMGNPDRVNNR
jgi:redox-sensitive bicupin YhaK (pirin superfamily)